MGSSPLWRNFFLQFNNFIFNYEASASYRNLFWRRRPSGQREDVVRIVNPPTFLAKKIIVSHCYVLLHSCGCRLRVL